MNARPVGEPAGRGSGPARIRLVPAVLGAMKVMDFVSSAGRARGNEVAAGSGLNASTCHDTLKTLVHGGYLSYDAETKSYSLGPVLTALGTVGLRGDDLVRAARPLMRRWVHDTRFTVFLCRWLPDRTIMTVDRIESTRDIKTTVEIGQRFPATAAALGKAFMAFMDERERDEVLRSLDFPAHTPNSLRTSESWIAELRRVRELGWSESHAEYDGGVNSVAAPVLDPRGEVLLVVGTVASVVDLPAERLPEYGSAMRRLAADIGETIFGPAPAAD